MVVVVAVVEFVSASLVVGWFVEAWRNTLRRHGGRPPGPPEIWLCPWGEVANE